MYLRYFFIFICGVLLGAIVSYFAVNRYIALKGGNGLIGLMSAIADVKKDKKTIDLVVCAALAKELGYEVNHLKLNSLLNDYLIKYDNGTPQAFNLLIFVKGYGMGRAEQIKEADKVGILISLQAQSRFPGVINMTKK